MSISAIDKTKNAASAMTVAQSLMRPSGQTSKALSAKSNVVAGTGAAGSAAAAAASTGQITSNDFLTLLVTEMKNQDPTQPTDPNAYIQQLVGVNSLQQLISINQELGTASGSGGSSSTNPAKSTSPVAG
jgi:flagellar basal-body rod modification protein FlgD